MAHSVSNTWHDLLVGTSPRLHSGGRVLMRRVGRQPRLGARPASNLVTALGSGRAIALLDPSLGRFRRFLRAERGQIRLVVACENDHAA